MAPIITEEQYRRWTGDNTSVWADLDDVLADAQEQVEEYLRRKLTYGSWTENLRMFYKPPGAWRYLGYFVYPSAVPIQSITAPANGAIYGYLIIGVTPPSILGSGVWSEDYAEIVSVTYTGGFTVDGVAGPQLPTTIGRAVARVAQSNIKAGPNRVPSGAVSVANGDIHVTFNKTIGSVGVEMLDKGTRLALKPWKKVEV